MRITITIMILLSMLAPAGAAERPYLEVARQAARWIAASAIQTDHGTVCPTRFSVTSPVIYSRTSGAA